MKENSAYPLPLQHTAQWFGKLPGIGKRTAERLALALMSWQEEDVTRFGTTLLQLRQQVGFCPVCGNYTINNTLCDICSDQRRQKDMICVVEQVSQIAVFEKTTCIKGLYHVLGGRLSPMNGIGPQDLRIEQLRRRLEAGGIRELMLATSADVEGEATAQYLAQEFSSLPITISRLAAGIPVGTDLAYTDAASLAAAINSRRPL